MSPKQERERQIAERYLLARARELDGAWADQAVRLTSRDRPDVCAAFAHGPTLGIEVTEFVCPRRARLRRFEALVARDVRSLLNATGTSGWFGIDAGGSSPVAGPGRPGAEVKARVVDALAHAIERAGGIERLVEASPRGSWRFEYRNVRSGRLATAVVDLERSASARGWRRRTATERHRPTRGEQARAEQDLVRLVAKKCVQAKRYPWTRYPLHLVVLHARGRLQPRPACRAALRAVLAEGVFGEAWLLRTDLAVRDVGPGEPSLQRLDTAALGVAG